MTPQPFSTTKFARAFVASLVKQGVHSIQPKAPAARQGFRGVLKALDLAIGKLKSQAAPTDRPLYRSLVSLKADLAPSNSGAYDGFEAALRNLQLSLTACPNPFYEDIEFSIPAPYALSVLSELSEGERDLVTRAAKAFVEARQLA